MKPRQRDRQTETETDRDRECTMNIRGKTQKPNERRNGTPKIISQGRDKYHVWRKGKGGQRGKDRREIKNRGKRGKREGEGATGEKNTTT